MKHTYSLSQSNEKKPIRSIFKLHNHDSYEIYMFMEGDADYIVEGNTYSLEPYDMIIIRRHEMHRVFHKSDKRYKRFIFNVYPEFFKENNCEEYEKQFLNNNPMLGNKISAEVVHSSGLYDAFLRMKQYSDNFKNIYTPIVKSVIIEFLYLINNVDTVLDDNNTTVKSIITYINNNYTNNITLEDVSKHFYISKYHLCRIFKKATGYTLHGYITHKRITRVKELISEGKNISDSAAEAGFDSYSSFYRAYINEYGVSPKEILK